MAVSLALAGEVGQAFVKEYYSRYSSVPSQLMDMYSRDSVMCHCDIGTAPTFVHGLSGISQALAGVSSTGGSKFRLHSVDSMPSVGSSVVVLVAGVMLTREVVRDFFHTFVLAPNRSARSDGGWYIHNDFMRLGENEEERPVEQERAESPVRVSSKQRRKPSPQQRPQQAAAPPPSPPAAPTPPRPASPQKAASPRQSSPRAPKPERAVEEAKGSAEQRETKQEAAAPQSPPEADAQPDFTTWANVVASKSRDWPAAAATAKVTAPSATAKSQAAAVSKQPEAGAQRKGGKGGGGGGGQKPQADGDSAPAQPKKFRYASLYVSQLPADFTEADIETIFSKYGAVMGYTHKQSERMCFVDFELRSSVEQAIADSEAGAVRFNDTRLRVQERKSPEQRRAERAAKQDGGRRKGGGKGNQD